MMSDFTYATGKRKNAISRTRLYAGTGQITVNGRPFEDYFPRKTLQMVVQQPLKLVRMLDKFDIQANCVGGGSTGQAEALRHGIARALCELNPELRAVLKPAGLLTRDARKKERKKYGLRGARASFQYSKR
ncbi:30S ribosomal protein S9 [Pseudodesulfovibrio sp.]|uniref:30S ribosomal protein S9 n=1 Tax=Pseudodesulfovibrio sp. TaxID=2035812 RepID=UPI0026176571|nr:30S ribosomal protein S9 [Pseudodesulfovibrio sp.]MDD3313393.1 30S ribosomal protein S9 [Pseudodesulfovibrio sp.]